VGVSIVNGNGIDRVFQVLGGANAAFSKLTVEGGIARDDGTAGTLPGTTASEGGGLLVQNGGQVTLSQVWVEGNQAVGGRGATGAISGAPGTSGKGAAGGGGFISAGTLGLTDSKVSGNAVTGGGGGDGYSPADHCTPTTHNLSCAGLLAGGGGAGGAGAGGGLYLLSGSLGLLRSTISGNNAAGAAGGRGGLACVDGLCHVTPFPGGNGGVAQGAGLFVGAGALGLWRTTVSGNSAIGGSGGVGGDQAAVGGSSQGAGAFAASGNISLANSTLFANTANGGPGGFYGCGCSRGRGQGGNAAGGGLYLSSAKVSLKGVTVASNRALAGANLLIVSPVRVLAVA
jgi:hypothetical protein